MKKTTSSEAHSNMMFPLNMREYTEYENGGSYSVWNNSLCDPPASNYPLKSQPEKLEPAFVSAAVITSILQSLLGLLSSPIWQC